MAVIFCFHTTEMKYIRHSICKMYIKFSGLPSLLILALNQHELLLTGAIFRNSPPFHQILIEPPYSHITLQKIEI
jgi:hypothetical protein